jgi:hypothetical protein
MMLGVGPGVIEVLGVNSALFAAVLCAVTLLITRHSQRTTD